MTTMATTPLPASFPAADEDTVAALQGAVGVLAAKWSVVVLARLTSGTHRFNELLRQIDGVSRRMLSATLRQLERDGLVLRHVYARVPARVEYELSDTGEALLAALALLLARGEIGSPDAARKGVDEALERDVPVDVESEAAARFERGESVHRAP